jgi:hypothetical protein
MSKLLFPGPLNGLHYTFSELAANPELKAHIKADRDLAWERGIIRRTVQYADSPDSGKPLPESPTS